MYNDPGPGLRLVALAAYVRTCIIRTNIGSPLIVPGKLMQGKTRQTALQIIGDYGWL